ncbi:CPBP family intramembrane glutamic endopeptidase [Erysipelothrix urinaevulpis]|uniref:CPBP family intramembrane glutamic endopeptidase n=1 Tax=Erysipelothrix urinaevulpis TaxID=2683717 RepID=UPI001359F3B4|nr:type II CAAX endopeptidase family protein [Erysipelothrix urinaevulpis]
MIRNRDLDNGRFKFGPKKSIGLVLAYFVGFQFVFILIGSLMFPPIGQTISPQAQMFSIIVTLVLTLFLVKDSLKRSFQMFKTNWKENLLLIVKLWIGIYIANLSVGLLIQFLGGGATSGNQETLEVGFGQFPVLFSFMAVVFAPIVEEIVFRGVLYQELRSEKSYILPTIVSSLSFGLLHTLPVFMMSGNPYEFLFLISYSLMGFFMVKAYERSGSIWTSIGLHFLNNGIATLVMLSMM